MPSITLQVSHGSDIHRANQWWAPLDEMPSYEALCGDVVRLLNLDPGAAPTLVMQHRDDAGDLCVLTAENLPDALISAFSSRLFSIEITGVSSGVAVPQPHATPWERCQVGLRQSANEIVTEVARLRATHGTATTVAGAVLFGPVLGIGAVAVISRRARR